MSSKYAPEAFNLTLRDLMDNDLLLDGKRLYSQEIGASVGPL